MKEERKSQCYFPMTLTIFHRACLRAKVLGVSMFLGLHYAHFTMNFSGGQPQLH